MIGLLNKPHYVFRPGQLLRRAARTLRPPVGEFVDVELPWGAPIAVRPEEEIGASILRIGVFDLCVSETIWRLLDPGDLAVDAGANIGQMTSAMAARTGRGGLVRAFEPHPQTFRELQANAERWSTDPRLAPIQLHELALSDHAGRARLGEPEEFSSNRGSAALVRRGASPAPAHDVALARLDELLDDAVAVLKVDVEGHELQMLLGASGLLEGGRIRDIVFEEWITPPSPVTRLLEEAGFTLFSLDQSLTRVRVGPPSRGSARRAHQAPSYLATREPARAARRLRRRGWAVLGTPLL